MNEIRAFVAHSFTEDDATVVAAFLKIFDQIQSLHSIFSWEHAEAAEPRELAEKVMQLIENKNLLIAICTKKELVISKSALREPWLKQGHWVAPIAEFHEKTSDWIIQEIGLAKRRGLELLLLIEEGVRPPGGLQGNVEYISFRRDAPEKSYGKILEMIRALSPRKNADASTVLEKTSQSESANEKQPAFKHEWGTPAPAWKRGDYRRAIFFALVHDDEEQFTRINDAFISTLGENDEVGRAEWEAIVERVRINLDKGGSLERLRTLSRDHPLNGVIAYNLGLSLSKFENHAEAASVLRDASVKSAESEVSRDLTCQAALEFARSGNLPASQDIIEKAKAQHFVDDQHERKLLDTIYGVFQVAKNENTALGVLERILEITPDDNSIRFTAAYKHSQLGSNDMALHHYLRIPSAERTNYSWNNLGVTFDSFEMTGKAVDAYRRAIEMNETLAMSNLANKFLKAGFFAEAQAELDKALAISNYHKNVGHSLASLKDAPEKEQDLETKVLDGVRQKVDFYKLVGKAIVESEVKSLAPKWQGPDCELSVSLEGRRFVAMGSYQNKGGGLSSLFSNPFVGTYKVRIEGLLVGRHVEATIKRSPDGAESASTLLSSENTSNIALIVLLEGERELKVMESPHAKTPAFYSLRCVAT